MYGAVAPVEEETMNTGGANTTGLSRSASGRLIQGLQRHLSQDWKKLLDAPASSCPVRATQLHNLLNQHLLLFF